MSGMVYEMVNDIEVGRLDEFILMFCPEYIVVNPNANIKDIKKWHKETIKKLFNNKLKIIHIEYRLVPSIDVENSLHLLTRYYFVRR